MDNDELLIRNFMKESRLEVKDDGFTRRVMRSLPETSQRRVRIQWGIVRLILYCIVAVAFVTLGGLDTLRGLTEGALADAFGALISGNVSWTTALVSLAACTFAFYYIIYSYVTKD